MKNVLKVNEKQKLFNVILILSSCWND